jgi:hypothetical protein
MKNIVIERYDETGAEIEPIEIVFGSVYIQCDTEYCAKGFDIVNHRAVHLNETFEEFATIRRNGERFFINAHPAVCPYCLFATKYSFEIKEGSLSALNVSKSVVSLSCVTPFGAIEYKRDPDSTIDDPNFNFLENINKGEAVYFYDGENKTESVFSYEAHFIAEGENCIVTPMQDDDSGYVEDIIVNGPLAVLKHATLVTSNKNVFYCDEVYSSDQEKLIAPGGDPDLFSNRVIICGENSPKWTRMRQTSQEGEGK